MDIRRRYAAISQRVQTVSYILWRHDDASHIFRKTHTHKHAVRSNCHSSATPAQTLPHAKINKFHTSSALKSTLKSTAKESINSTNGVASNLMVSAREQFYRLWTRIWDADANDDANDSRTDSACKRVTMLYRSLDILNVFVCVYAMYRFAAWPIVVITIRRSGRWWWPQRVRDRETDRLAPNGDNPVDGDRVPVNPDRLLYSLCVYIAAIMHSRTLPATIDADETASCEESR